MYITDHSNIDDLLPDTKGSSHSTVSPQ